VLRFVPGSTMGDADPVPARFRGPVVLRAVGEWLRALHEATASFPTDERVWRRGRLARREGAVICHHDISPHNIVLDDQDGIAAVLDWDMAAPGHPLDDVAFAAWQFVLRHGLPVAEEATGLRILAEAYRVDPHLVLDRVGPRLRGALRFMRRGAADGDEGLARLLTTGVPESVQAGLADLEHRRARLDALL
jgi:aminoglycoside phosphotransferase (APT) family kinase protein